MPRYFFDIAAVSRDRDMEGTELHNDNAARIEAIKFVGEMLAHQPSLLQDRLSGEVMDVSDRLLFTIAMLAIDAPR